MSSDSFDPSQPLDDLRSRLTVNELSLLQIFASGVSAMDAAQSLSLDLVSVGALAHSVRRKLGVTSTAAAVEAARQSGHLPPQA